MKQLILAVLLGLVISIPTVTSQTSGFSQIGKVSQEMQTEGLFIAHSSLPLNSKAKIVNTSTGKEVEVTVIRQIPASPDRIADISPLVWWELGLTPDINVRIFTSASRKPQNLVIPTDKIQFTAAEVAEIYENGYNDGYDDGYYDGFYYVDDYQAASPATTSNARPQQAQPVPVVETRPQQAQPAPVVQTRPQQALPNMLIVTQTTTTQSAPVIETRLQQAQPVNTARPQQTQPAPVAETRPQQAQPVSDIWAQIARPATVTAPPASVPAAVQGKEIQVTPGLPDANSNKIYQLQVGAFASPEIAARTVRQLENAGYSVINESTGSVSRVTIKGIPAAMVNNTVQQLKAFGIEQVWIRE